MLTYKWLLNSVAVFSPPKEGEPGAADPPAGDGKPAAGDGQGEAGGDGGAEGAGDAGDGAGDPPAGDGEVGDGEPGDGKQAAPPAKPDWRDKELPRKHAQLQAEKRENARLKQELEDAKALLARQPKKEGEAAPAAQPERAYTKEDVDRAAAIQVAQGDYDRQCNDTFAKGKAAYKDDWDKALSQLNVLGGLGDDQQGVEVMQGILATDDPAKVLYVLGSQPDEYHRIMGLPPARRSAELVKLGIPDKKPVKKPSALDPPPTGLTRRAEANNDTAILYDDKTDDEKWYAARSAQKARNFAKTGNPFRSA